METRRPKHSCEHEYLSYRPVAIESKHHAIEIDDKHESFVIIDRKNDKMIEWKEKSNIYNCFRALNTGSSAGRGNFHIHQIAEANK